MGAAGMPRLTILLTSPAQQKLLDELDSRIEALEATPDKIPAAEGAFVAELRQAMDKV